jgi:hypothetical protein
VTLLTVVAVALTVVVAAVTIGIFEGGDVTISVEGGTSSVMYSLDNINGPWTATLEAANTTISWFTMLDVSADEMVGPVTITWELEQKTGPATWTPVSGATTTTTVSLTGSAQEVYASVDGSVTGNHDWSGDVPAAGTYHVVATVESA